MVEVRQGSLGRQVALTVVVFAAVLVLLVGLGSLANRSTPGPSGSAGASLAAAVGSASPGASGAASGSPGASGSPTASASGVPGASGSPAASSSPGQPADVVLVGAGDIANCDLPGDEATARLIEGIPGTVFTAGDDAYPSGTLQQFQDCYGPTWGRFLDRTLLPSPGNHDWETAKLEGYYGYFGARAHPDGTSWYSTDLGAWHVVVLDSECGAIGGCGADSPEGRWLSADLAASSARCTLAIWHKPRWSSGTHGNDRGVAPFWEQLYSAGADLIVNGHDHDYERFAPQDPSGKEDRTRGIREFVVGTGGAELRDFGRIASNSELRIGGYAGVFKLTLKTDSYDWAFVPATGEVTDAGTAHCH